MRASLQFAGIGKVGELLAQRMEAEKVA
jgi:hypothetical protein